MVHWGIDDMFGKFILKFLLYNRKILCLHIHFFRNLFWFKFYTISLFLNNKNYHCLIQSSSKKSFLSKPKLNRFSFRKYQQLGMLPFRKS